jgi:L-aminoadipate-semialdehyde dehydrogenase
MPLNPNGKIDKPALPFPDTAQAVSAPKRRRGTNASRPGTGFGGADLEPQSSEEEETMRAIWALILPNPPSPIPLNESFFDLGGHSILATRLVFEIRKTFVVEAPLGLVFEQPTIAGLVAAIARLRSADLGLVDGAAETPESGAGRHFDVSKPSKQPITAPLEYGADYENLLARLRKSYPRIPTDFPERRLTVFLTGATGFLGAFILRDLLVWTERVKKVICLVRGGDSVKALARLREGTTDRGVWEEEWVERRRVEVVAGDLGQDLFGMDRSTWDRIAAESDVILHNGAFVSGHFSSYIESGGLSANRVCSLGSLGVPV